MNDGVCGVEQLPRSRLIKTGVGLVEDLRQKDFEFCLHLGFGNSLPGVLVQLAETFHEEGSKLSDDSSSNLKSAPSLSLHDLQFSFFRTRGLIWRGMSGDGFYRGSGSFTTGPERRSTIWFLRLGNISFRQSYLTMEAIAGVQLSEKKMVMMEVA